MAIKGRISLALGRNIPTAEETQGVGTVSFERVIHEFEAMRHLGVDAAEHLSDYLRDAGSKIMAIDSPPKTYTYVVPAGKQAVIESLTVLIVDAGITDLWGAFGAAAVLTNGLAIYFDDGAIAPAVPTILHVINGGDGIRRTSDLVRISDTFAHETGPSDIVRARIRLARGVRLTQGQRVVCAVGDDLSTLLEVNVMIQGVLRSADAV